MNLSATTSSIADVLNAVLTDFSEIQKSWEADMKKISETADSESPIALATITSSPVITSETMMPGLERPMHYVHSLERHKAWYEQELVKQQQEEKAEREINAPSTSTSVPSSSSSSKMSKKRKTSKKEKRRRKNDQLL